MDHHFAGHASSMHPQPTPEPGPMTSSMLISLRSTNPCPNAGNTSTMLPSYVTSNLHHNHLSLSHPGTHVPCMATGYDPTTATLLHQPSSSHPHSTYPPPLHSTPLPAAQPTGLLPCTPPMQGRTGSSPSHTPTHTTHMPTTAPHLNPALQVLRFMTPADTTPNSSYAHPPLTHSM